MQDNTLKTKEMILSRLSSTNMPSLSMPSGSVKFLGTYLDASDFWNSTAFACLINFLLKMCYWPRSLLHTVATCSFLSNIIFRFEQFGVIFCDQNSYKFKMLIESADEEFGEVLASCETTQWTQQFCCAICRCQSYTTPTPSCMRWSWRVSRWRTPPAVACHVLSDGRRWPGRCGAVRRSTASVFTRRRTTVNSPSSSPKNMALRRTRSTRTASVANCTWASWTLRRPAAKQPSSLSSTRRTGIRSSTGSRQRGWRNSSWRLEEKPPTNVPPEQAVSSRLCSETTCTSSARCTSDRRATRPLDARWGRQELTRSNLH